MRAGLVLAHSGATPPQTPLLALTACSIALNVLLAALHMLNRHWRVRYGGYAPVAT